MEIDVTIKQKLIIENFTGNANGKTFQGIRFRTGKRKKKTLLHFHYSKAHYVIDALKECLAGIDVNQQSFYDSPAWQELRYKTLRRFRKCCLCGSTENLHCDHIKPRSLYPALELEPDNMQILCQRCNIAKSNHDSEDYR